MSLVLESRPNLHDDGSRLVITVGDMDIATYNYLPDAPPAEAPKPYLYPLRTLSGAPLGIERPWDHRWHKGLQMTWSHISGQNFWGGPTFSADEGYVWRDNLGRIRHDGFRSAVTREDRIVIEEDLTWITSEDEHWLGEIRTHVFHGIDLERGIWALDFGCTLENIADHTLQLGSPTTHGRPEAGYTGLFWRGPRSWTDGQIYAAGDVTGESLMGTVAEWAAFVGQHDVFDGGGTVLMFAGTSTAETPIKWFGRSQPFACLAPSPAFDTEVTLEPGAKLELSHRVVFIDRMCDRAALDELIPGLRP